MKLLHRVNLLFRRSDGMKAQLFVFLSGDRSELKLIGSRVSREEARGILQELIPARVEMRGVCMRPLAAVVAAPHVSFDNWSEHFCNRIARRLRIGWVVAKNFRDQHGATIPVSIGRHIHVNRPTESERYGAEESETPRAHCAYAEYTRAIAQAGGRGSLPVDVLLEIHSHHRTRHLEIATSGLSAELAKRLLDDWNALRADRSSLPEMRIEPLHEVQLPADAAKRHGTMRPEVAALALHVEIPREARDSEESRRGTRAALVRWVDMLIDREIDAGADGSREH